MELRQLKGFFEQSIQNLETVQLDSESKTEIEKIKNESDKKTKSERFRDFLSRHESSATTIIVESVKTAFNTWLSGGVSVGGG